MTLWCPALCSNRLMFYRMSYKFITRRNKHFSTELLSFFILLITKKNYKIQNYTIIFFSQIYSDLTFLNRNHYSLQCVLNTWVKVKVHVPPASTLNQNTPAAWGKMTSLLIRLSLIVCTKSLYCLPKHNIKGVIFQLIVRVSLDEWADGQTGCVKLCWKTIWGFRSIFIEIIHIQI